MMESGGPPPGFSYFLFEGTPYTIGVVCITFTGGCDIKDQ